MNCQEDKKMDSKHIHDELIKIFKELFNLDFNQDYILRDEKLLGKKIHLAARDMLWLFFVLESSFGITFDEEDVESGKFATFVHIEELLTKELNSLVEL